jgi:hypothetical protein
VAWRFATSHSFIHSVWRRCCPLSLPAAGPFGQAERVSFPCAADSAVGTTQVVRQVPYHNRGRPSTRCAISMQLIYYTRAPSSLTPTFRVRGKDQLRNSIVHSAVRW